MKGGSIVPYAIDLFCGAGGMSEGLIQSGFHILFSSDISVDVQRTYMNRHEQLGFIQGYNTYFHQGDIRELTGTFIKRRIKELTFFNNDNNAIPKKIDAIFGGPPCQGFSRAGKRNPDDPRNLLFKEYLRVIKQVKPRYVVMENVEGFTDTKFYGFKGVTGNEYEDGSLAPEILRNEFNLIGYNTLEPRILDASDYGVPQRRRRIIFIAYRKKEKVPIYPEPIFTDENRLTVLDAIGDLIRDDRIRREINPEPRQYQVDSINGRTRDINKNIIYNNNVIHNNDVSAHLPIIVERFSLFKEGEDGSAIKRRILSEGIDISNKPKIIDECCEKLNFTREDLIEKFRNADVNEEMLDALLTKKSIRTKLDRNKSSLTVVTLPDDYISPFENRTLSVREMARLQSFDDSFIFLGKRTTGGKRRRVEVPQYTQVGNAVPPLLAKAIASEIIKVL
jgi:DNA (cytosine-5)-methyltransferase 1